MRNGVSSGDEAENAVDFAPVLWKNCAKVHEWERFADGWRDAVLALDREYRIHSANTPAGTLFGKPIGELIGTTLRESAPQRADALEAAVRRAFTEGTVYLGVSRPFGDEPLSVLARRVGEDAVAMTLHRETDANWPTDPDWSAALENEQRFRSIFDYSPDAMLALAMDGGISDANQSTTRDFGYPRERLIGRSALELIAEPDRRSAHDAFRGARRGIAGTLELSALRADGTTFPILATVIPIVYGGTITGVHLVARDLTAIRRAEREVAAQSERLRELYLVAASANATAETIIASTIDAGCRMLGMASGALYDADSDRNVATVGEPVPRRLARLALATEGALAIEDLRGLPYLSEPEIGEEPPAAYIGTALDVGGNRYGTLSFSSQVPRREPFSPSDRDLVQLMGALVGSAIERGRSRTRLRQLAYNDPVTALPNRAWFTERLREELARAAKTGARVAMMVLDLDRFKDINDTLGHGLGDRILQIVGDRLAAAADADGIVARMGGDEFIVLVGHDPTRERLETLAARLLNAVDEPIVVDEYEQFLTGSIGISVAPRDGDDVETLVKHADVAMYRAKERGRNTFQFFTPALGASVRTRISQEKSLRKALERGEFVVHYQPQLSLDGDRVVALEALVRWQHPRLGLVGPDQFIPSAEMSGLIVPLGDWVLETAARQVRAWQDIFPGLRLAVNLSARQFHQAALATKVSEALRASGLRAADLEIEITESVAMSDAALSSQILTELRHAGVRLAVDDFGTGYSSLGYLRRFALDCLKIDKSFVREVQAQRDDATIVRTVIAMAHSLGLEVCAEGVETPEQLAFLRQERCDRIQGFLYARPMDPARLTAFLRGRGIGAVAG